MEAPQLFTRLAEWLIEGSRRGRRRPAPPPPAAEIASPAAEIASPSGGRTGLSEEAKGEEAAGKASGGVYESKGGEESKSGEEEKDWSKEELVAATLLVRRRVATTLKLPSADSVLLS